MYREVSHPVDVSEREEGKKDGGNEWGDIQTAGVRVGRCSKSALGQDGTLWVACGSLKPHGFVTWAYKHTREDAQMYSRSLRPFLA